MVATVRESRYVLTAEDRTRIAFESLKRNFDSTQRSLNLIRNLTAGAFSVAGVTAFVRTLATAEQAQNRLTAVINAQGHAAGFTRRQLDDMADALALASQFDDEDFRNGQATLLKFGNVYNDVFSRALKLSADLASFQGTELSAGIEAVGKALQNPAEGIKQLQAAIGRLDPAQTKMLDNLVAQNRVVQAQNLLLDILQKKVGGAAGVINSGFSKSLSDVAKNFGELLEALGKTALVQGTVQGFFGFLNTSLRDMKSIIESGDWFGGLMFLLGFRGHELSASGVAASKVTSLDGMISAIQGQIDAGNGGRDVESRLRELQKQRAAAFKQFEESGGFTGAVTKGAKSPKPTIDNGLAQYIQKNVNLRALEVPGRNVLGLNAGFFIDQFLAAGGDRDNSRANALGLTPEFFSLAEKAQQYAELDLRQLHERQAATRATGDAVAQYTKLLEFEIGQAGSNTRERAARIDALYLESIGVKQGTEEWARYTAQIERVRKSQDRLTQSFEFGADRALTNYLDLVRDVSSQSESLFTKAFSNMEDALVEFVRTGKLSFSDLANQIIADLIRIQVRQSITGPLAQGLNSESAAGVLGFFGKFFGGGTSAGTVNIGGLASGGPMSAFTPYLVGERGPELVVPRADSTVIPNHALGGPQVFIDARGADAAGLARLEQTVRELNGSFDRRAVAAVSQSRVRGGFR